ncbi:hypothetical protein B0H10DRAFT_520086 [Mycena sp. CBHHK59/15]|nr:hypothetical protein B0H10DRAFT_520086 [Mycena sp. CBHHK59/15]
MEHKSPDSLVEECVAQLQLISRRRNALLRQMFHMVQGWQSAGSVLPVDEEEEDDDLVIFLDRFDLSKNPDTGSIHHPVHNDLFTATASPEPTVSSPCPSSSPLSPRPTPAQEYPKHTHSESPHVPIPATVSPEPGVESPIVAPAQASRANSVSARPSPTPAAESEDELDLIGTPAVSTKPARSQSRPPSEVIHIIDSSAPDKIIVVDGDDSADGEQIIVVDGDTTDEEDTIQITQPTLEGSVPQVPIVVEEVVSEHRREATSSSNEQGPNVQEVAAEEPTTEADVASPDADEAPAEFNGMVVEEDIFSVHDELTPPPDAESEPPVDTGAIDPPTADTVEDVREPEAVIPEDVVMDEDVPVEVEEPVVDLNQGLPSQIERAETPLSDDESPVVDLNQDLPSQIERAETPLSDDESPVVDLNQDLPSQIERAETPLSDDESMVIDDDEDQEQHEPPSRAETLPKAIPVHYFTKEPSPQPIVVTVPPQPVIIPEPTSTLSPPSFDFTVNTEPAPPAQPEPPASPTQTHPGYHPTYTLPPLKSLPADFSRKIKPGKQQRKHKDREKNNGGDKSKDKDDWVPMGISRWRATLRANPVWKKVSRAPKCLSTREWSVAMVELRLIRALDQVESLKDAGRWSFRQPKKQRGVGGLTKTHWDYLMDEMKWMRIDFREERKWKLALAYNLSTAVLEWHCFSSLAERVAKGICVKWKRPRDDDVQEEYIVNEDILPLEQPGDVEMGEAHAAPAVPDLNSLLTVDYGTDDDDDDEQEKQSVLDALEPSSILDDALDTAEKGPAASATDSGFNSIELRGEDSEEPPSAPEPSIKMEVDDEADADVDKPTADDATQTDEPAEKAAGAEKEKPAGLKDSSSDPTLSQLDSVSTIGGDVAAAVQAKSSSKANIYAPLREYLAYSGPDKLFVDLDDLALVQHSDGPSADPAFPPTDLSAIFPDLPPLGLLDVPPPVISVPEGRKKSEKRADRDDPNKRAEDTMYTKLFPIGKFMYTKPTLVGPLQPVKRWKNGRWLNADDSPALDTDTPPVKPEDSASELFNSKPANSVAVMQKTLEQLKDAKEPPRRAAHMWTQVDDNLLKSFVDRYPNNWPLIAECYNSARLTISTDRRTPRDCQERWKEKWAAPPKPAEAAVAAAATGLVEEMPPPPPTPSMTTRGIKRLASTSVSGPSPSVASGSEKKKQRRHQYVQETMRKAAKKRAELALKMSASQRKPPAVHETHAQYSRLPKLSPAELSRMKAEKDYKDQQDLLLHRRKHDEMARQAQAAAAQRAAASPVPVPGPGQPGQAAQPGLPGQQQPQQQQQQPQAAPAQQQAVAQAQAPTPAQVLAQQQQAQIAQLQQVQAQRVAAAAARSQVNISQQQAAGVQQRIASPLAGGAPAARVALTPQQQQQQLLVQQARLHQQQLAHQQAQAALAHQQAQPGGGGARAGTSSPRPAGPGGAAGGGAAVVPGNAVPRAGPGHYVVQNMGGLGQYSHEQLQHAVRMQMMQQAQLAAAVQLQAEMQAQAQQQQQG